MRRASVLAITEARAPATVARVTLIQEAMPALSKDRYSNQRIVHASSAGTGHGKR